MVCCFTVAGLTAQMDFSRLCPSLRSPTDSLFCGFVFIRCCGAVAHHQVDSLFQELQQERAAGREAAQHASEELSAANTRIRALESDIASRDADISSKRLEIEQLTRELEEARAQAERETAELNARIKAGEDQVAALRQGAQGDQEAFERANAAAQAEQQRLQQELDATVGQLGSVRDQLAQTTKVGLVSRVQHCAIH